MIHGYGKKMSRRSRVEHSNGAVVYLRSLCSSAASSVSRVASWGRHGILCALLISSASLADEGLWLPEQQPNWPIQPHASAVLKVGGCTGTFVSADGLVLTNHHCILDLLQYRSTVENNYLETGFLAISKELELLAPQDFTIAHTLERTEVTQQVLSGVSARTTGSERFNLIASNRNELLRRCEDSAGIQCRVVDHYDGLGYLLVRDRIFSRVKLVWAPPADVGHFGGIEDNWQWPRHSADLALLRVYNADGTPYQPAHWLPLSPAAPADGEPVFVEGFPGVTQRYRLRKEVTMAFDEFYPYNVRYLQRWMQVLTNAMEDNPDISLRYVPTMVRLGNRYQNLRGLLAAGEQYQIHQLAAEQEHALREWIAEHDDVDRYQAAIATTEQALATRQALLQRQVWWNFFQELQLPSIAQRLYRLAQESGRSDERRTRGFQIQQVPAIRAQLIGQARQFAAAVESELLVELLLLHQELPEEQRISFVEEFFALHAESSRESIQKTVNALYAASKLGDIAEIERLMSTPLNDIRRSNDPWLRFAMDTANERLRWDLQERELRGFEQQGRSVLMDAFRREARAEGRRLPDNANRTYRLSAGIVAAVESVNAESTELHEENEHEANSQPQRYDVNVADVNMAVGSARTTLNSLLAIAGSAPRYQLPFSMHAAAAVHGAGCLAASPDQLTLNFLSTADGTGGSSGSPTVNSRGELIGLVFDSTGDAILSDWHFVAERHRLIHADVRYLLWLLRYVYQAHELMAELGFAEDADGCTLNGRPIIPVPARADDLHPALAE